MRRAVIGSILCLLSLSCRKNPCQTACTSPHDKTSYDYGSDVKGTATIAWSDGTDTIDVDASLEGEEPLEIRKAGELRAAVIFDHAGDVVGKLFRCDSKEDAFEVGLGGSGYTCTSDAGAYVRTVETLNGTQDGGHFDGTSKSGSHVALDEHTWSVRTGDIECY